MSKPDILRLLTAQQTGTSATPDEVRTALSGPPVDEDKPQKVVYDLANPNSNVPNFRDLSRGGPPSRRTQRLHRDKGGRSLQGNGNGHGRTFIGRG